MPRSTLPETNVFAPENGWLECFLVSFWDFAYFQGLCPVSFRGYVDSRLSKMVFFTGMLLCEFWGFVKFVISLETGQFQETALERPILHQRLSLISARNSGVIRRFSEAFLETGHTIAFRLGIETYDPK